MTTATTNGNLTKAAEHFTEAAKHYREAALDESQGREHDADHHVRLGAAHAAHAHDHAEEATKVHATGTVKKCSC